MKRLTEHHVNKKMGVYMVCSGACDDFNCTDCEKFNEIVDRLAAYEDTGLELEDIDALQKRERGLAEMLVNVSCGCVVPYTCLAELAQAEKDGRLVVLPPNEPLTLEQLRAMDGEPVWGADGQCYIVNVKAGYAVDKDRGFRMLWSNGFFYRRKREEEDNETD